MNNIILAIHINNDMNINIHTDINMNVDIHIIINMNIETYINVYVLSILYSLLPTAYCRLPIAKSSGPSWQWRTAIP